MGWLLIIVRASQLFKIKTTTFPVATVVMAWTNDMQGSKTVEGRPKVMSSMSGHILYKTSGCKEHWKQWLQRSIKRSSAYADPKFKWQSKAGAIGGMLHAQKHRSCSAISNRWPYFWKRKARLNEADETSPLPFASSPWRGELKQRGERRGRLLSSSTVLGESQCHIPPSMAPLFFQKYGKLFEILLYE